MGEEVFVECDVTEGMFSRASSSVARIEAEPVLSMNLLLSGRSVDGARGFVSRSSGRPPMGDISGPSGAHGRAQQWAWCTRILCPR